jgi:flagellum-specific peptidoglycan hydrolase FlgJ
MGHDQGWLSLTFLILQTCVSYLVDRWYRDYQRFKGVNRATTAEECARLLVTEGYATDPQYAEKLIRIMKENG